MINYKMKILKMKTMKTIKTMFAAMALLMSVAMQAQTQGVSIKTTVGPPHQSAMLDVASSNKGLLIPRVNLQSTTDQVTIPSPANSLMVFNTNTTIIGGEGYYFWSTAASQWIKMSSSVGGFWSAVPNTSTDIQYLGGKVRIGNNVNPPTYDFEIDNPSNYYTSRFEGLHGTLNFGTTDPLQPFGPGSYLVHSSKLDGANNYFSIRYAQVHGDGKRGLELTTWIKPPNANTSFTTIDANANAMYLLSTSNIIFVPNSNFNGGFPALSFNSAGQLVGPSDSTKKTNITNLPSVLNKVLQLRPVKFNWKTSPNATKINGLIAQEVQLLFPEIVTDITGQIPGTAQPTTTKAMNYEALIPILIKALQEQQTQIQALQNRVTILENK